MRRPFPLLAALTLLAGAIPAVGVLGEDPLETVTIYRDTYGVPHLYADDDYALWYANGYVHGLDRLWQMDLTRHLGYGEASSVVGPGGGILALDLESRRDLYTKEELDELIAQVDPVFVEIVQAYADGVNRAAAELLATGDFPAEFPALQHAWEPWTVRDTVAVAVFLLANFGNGGGSEVSNAKLLAQLETTLGDADAAWAAFEDLVRVRNGASYPTVPESEGSYALQPVSGPKAAFSTLHPDQQAAALAAQDEVTFGLDAVPSDVIAYLEEEGVVPDLTPKFGSNALTVAPWLSETGEAMVGGGPQMGYFNPQFPFELGLHGGDRDAVGMGVVGAPGVIIGRVANVAWTVTSGISDQADMVALPAAGERSYTWDGETKDLDCRTEVHRLFTPPATGGPALDFVEQEVCISHVGPVTGVTLDDEGEPAWFFARERHSYKRDLPSAVKWLSVSAATDVDDLMTRFDGFVFTFNFNIAGEGADETQKACYMHVGTQPVRHPDLDPRLPTPAGDGWQWQGLLTGADLPRTCNPADGYTANWNNLPQRDWPAGDSRELWGSVHRVERLDKAFNEAVADDPNDKLDLEQVKEVLREAATHDSLAAGIVPAILANDPGADATVALAALQSWADDDFPWDVMVEVAGERYYAHPGHTVYDALVEGLVPAVLGDELGNHTRGVSLDPRGSSDPHAGDHGQHNNPFAVVVDALSGETTRAWCDDVTTGLTETCADMVLRVLEEANLTGLGDAGEIALTAEHRSPFTSLGTGPAPTMPMTNRATYYHFHVGADPTTSVSALAPGNSGHVNLVDLALLQADQPAPAHMRDQLDLYVGFGFKPLPFTEGQAAGLAASVETLVVPKV